MKNGNFTNTIMQMQYVSRWNEFAPRYKDNAASHSFRCAAIAIMIGIIEEKVFSNKVDKLKLVSRALLHDLNETVTGSIKYVTKKDPLIAHHIRVLEREVSNTIVSNLSRSLRPTFHDFIVDAEDHTDLGKIVSAIDSFDAMLFCFREQAVDANNSFKAMYEQLHAQLKQSDVQSIVWLLAEFDKHEGVFEFLEYILNLDKIERWGGTFNLVPDNDATHSFRVAALSLFNGLLESERFGRKEIRLYQLLGKSIMHDIVECLSGDVASPIKKSTEETKEAFEQYEKEVARAMAKKLPDFFQEEIIDFMVHSKDRSYEGQLVEISDKIDALIKSNLEMRNNPHYTATYYQQLTYIQHHYENPCVIFFLAYILHDLTFSNFMR